MWVWEGFYLEDPCELTFANTLLLSNAAISLGNAFINLEISSEYIIFFTLWSFFLSSLFISLQIKEFRILALSINDSLYSSLFFFLTGLHFFHLSIGLILLIYFWCSRSSFTSSGWRLVTLTSILAQHIKDYYFLMLFYLSFWSFLFIIWFYWNSLTNTLSGFFSLIIFFIILYYYFFFFVVRLTLNHHYTEPRRYQHFFNPLHFTRSPHGVSEVRHEPREGREVGERREPTEGTYDGRLSPWHGSLPHSSSLLHPLPFPLVSLPPGGRGGAGETWGMGWGWVTNGMRRETAG